MSLLTELCRSEGINYPIGDFWDHLRPEKFNTSLYLFGIWLENDDPRWKIVHAWSEICRTEKVLPIHKEASLSSVYLSPDNPSFRSGYSLFISEPNLRQLCRAINNLGAWSKLNKVWQLMPDTMLSEWKMKLARTERITRGTDRQGITGCPEALYQIQLFKQEKYVGRVGFNLHHEKVWRVTIANLQGIPGGCPEYLEFLERHGIGPFNELMQTAKTLFRRFDSNTMILGLRNPSTDNSDLLNTVLEAEEIQRARFRRKD